MKFLGPDIVSKLIYTDGSGGLCKAVKDMQLLHATDDNCPSWSWYRPAAHHAHVPIDGSKYRPSRHHRAGTLVALRWPKI